VRQFKIRTTKQRMSILNPHDFNFKSIYFFFMKKTLLHSFNLNKEKKNRVNSLKDSKIPHKIDLKKKCMTRNQISYR